jgi:alpha-glucosidase
VEAQDNDPDSTLNLYRTALRMRRDHPRDGLLAMLIQAPGVLAFARSNGLACLVNMSEEVVSLPAGKVVLSSSEIVNRRLAPDTSVWLVPERSAVV